MPVPARGLSRSSCQLRRRPNPIKPMNPAPGRPARRGFLRLTRGAVSNDGVFAEFERAMIQEGVRAGREGRALIGVGRRLSCTQHPKTHGYILPQPWYEMPNVRGFPLSTGSGVARCPTSGF